MREGSLSAAAVGPRALGRPLAVGDVSARWGPKHCSRVKGALAFLLASVLADTGVVEIRRLVLGLGLGFGDGDE